MQTFDEWFSQFQYSFSDLGEVAVAERWARMAWNAALEEVAAEAEQK